MLGKNIKSIHNTDKLYTINISNLSKGIYFIKLTDSSNKNKSSLTNEVHKIVVF